MSGKRNDFVENLKENINIIDVISDYTPLKRSGKNYKGLCPFHREKTPSFTVNPEKQFYYCFGCGVGGDIINFLMELENITFRQTLKILAERAGMTLPENDNPYQRRIRAERERIFQINQLTAKFYHYLLTKNKVGNNAASYLEKRGFSKEDFQKYNLGYAPDSWRSLLKFLTGRGFEKNLLLKAGLITKGKNNTYYDRFRDRVIFPIFNIRNEVIAFGGRIIIEKESSPKYLNSPDTPVYNKGENLYGLNWARKHIRQTDNAIVMEGYTDVLTAQKAGIKNAIASLGTAFTVEQARLLNRYANNVYIAYDADAAGARATLRGLDILNNEGLNVRVIRLPATTDPDDYLKKEGKSGFNKLKEEAINLVEFKIEQIANNYNRTKVDEEISFTKELIKILAKINDEIEREIHLENSAQKYKLNSEIIKKGLKRFLKIRDRNKKDKNYKNRYTKKDNETKPEENINNIEEKLLKLYIDNPHKRNQLQKYLQPEFFSNDYQKIVKLFKEKSYTDINSFINSLDDDVLKKQIISLLVTEKNFSESYDMVLKKYKKKIKGGIYRKLRQYEKLNITEVNKLLMKFVELTI